MCTVLILHHATLVEARKLPKSVGLPGICYVLFSTSGRDSYSGKLIY